MLRLLFIVHAVLTFAAGIVLIAAPEAIPGVVDIHIEPGAYLICYLLGTSELALAYLSFESRKITDEASLRLISLTFVIFHTATAALEIYAFKHGASAKLWSNILFRIVVSMLFAHYGLYKKQSAPTSENL